jgi:hypothetical protein
MSGNATLTSEWVSGNQARRILGCRTWYRLHREALFGNVRYRVLADVVRFCREDLERLARDREPVEKPVKNGSDVSCSPKEETRGACNTGVSVDAREAVTRGDRQATRTLSREGNSYAQS